ncbi:MAG: ATP-binding protein [Acidobacteria bacterium]|nr:ATP-binding protein [Acidobacteriota bacterium]
MPDPLRDIVLDFREAVLPTGVPRRIEVTPVPGKATVCIGPRRAGKSTFLFQQVQKLLDRGVPRDNILYVNFFDDRLRHLQHEGPGSVADAYFSLHPEKKNAEKIYCFFDEIQVVPGWEPFVDRLMQTEACEVYVTGSSARMLSREIATQMRGRALPWEIFPFSFREFLDFEGLDAGGPLSTRRRLLVRKAFEKYWERGGFPEVAGLDRGLRIRIHQEYWGAMLFRDLVERHDVAHPRAVSDLAQRLVDNTASLYSINRLTAYLQSLGHRAPKPAVSDYVAWFEDAFFLFTVPVFDASLARARTNPKKIYCVDHALVRSVGSGILVNSGHLLENLVFTALRRSSPKIAYFKGPNGRKVDFVAVRPDGSRVLVQVCESLAEPRTRKREVTALAQAMAALGTRTGTVVTRDEEETIAVDAGSIEVVPAWRFLLDVG